MEKQKYVPFFVDVYVAVKNINVFNVAKKMLQWVPFAPLSSYKMFCTDVNDTKYYMLRVCVCVCVCVFLPSLYRVCKSHFFCSVL
jgi:hypothetical protein